MSKKNGKRNPSCNIPEDTLREAYLEAPQRKIYWDNYSKYWQEKTTTTDVEYDSKPGEVFQHYLDVLDIREDDNVLDVGVGLGRLIPVLAQICNPFGIDLSQPSVKIAQKRFGDRCGLCVSEERYCPFKDASFDKIICWATFDALYQNEALIEMNRMLKVGGRVLISGKNDLYPADDSEALIAEINARKNNHPNYFTDIKMLAAHIKQFGFHLLLLDRFKRRGDFSVPKRTEADIFYEYVIVLEKTKQANIDFVQRLKLSREFSRTYNHLNKTNGLDSILNRQSVHING